MSLFKVSRGSEANLPTQKTDGWAYFCTDTGSFWIDHLNSDNTLVRSKISANFADKLRYVKDGETVELDPSEIATQAEIANAISAETQRAEGVESGLDTRIKTIEDDYLESAAADATSKANTAESNAKDYADGLNTTMNTRVDTLEVWHDNFIEASEEDINALFA